MQPEVGQYWTFMRGCTYNHCSEDVKEGDILTGKILTVDSRGDYFIVDRLGTELYIHKSMLVKEWKPNKFWRFLGW